MAKKKNSLQKSAIRTAFKIIKRLWKSFYLWPSFFCRLSIDVFFISFFYLKSLGPINRMYNEKNCNTFNTKKRCLFSLLFICLYSYLLIAVLKKNGMNLKSISLLGCLEIGFYPNCMQICSIFCNSIRGDNYEWLLNWLHSINFFLIWNAKCKQNLLLLKA